MSANIHHRAPNKTFNSYTHRTQTFAINSNRVIIDQPCCVMLMCKPPPLLTTRAPNNESTTLSPSLLPRLGWPPEIIKSPRQFHENFTIADVRYILSDFDVFVIW